jgi:formate hydrogenlyase subunit 3/multisubunit Na+/H+ antiporter MnhD subunit
VKATYILPALPAAAALSGLIFIIAMRFARLRWVALAWYTASVPVAAITAYRLWDHHVGPDAFTLWRFAISPSNISFLLLLAVTSPPLLWVLEKKGRRGGSQRAFSALACFALAAALAAVMSDHIFLLAGLFTLASWCMVGAIIMRGRKAGRLLPFLFPLGLADLCLALGVLFFYLSDPTRGLFLPASPLEPAGRLSLACALMLAAALLRLGSIPMQRWMAGIAEGGKDLRLMHILVVDLVLGTFLLFMVSRVLFAWDGVWVWVCLGLSAATLAELLRELLQASRREEVWGLACAALGAGLALISAPGGQAAAAAARLGLWAAVPALALVEMGSEAGNGKRWMKVVGGASLMGLPPLAGFAWLWMGYQVLAGEFAEGVTVVFLAAIPIFIAGALIVGGTALLLPHGGEEETSPIISAAAGVLMAALCVVVGLYPGTLVDLLMREYGLPVNIPFSSWTALGWGITLCATLAVVLLSAWSRKGEISARGVAKRTRALPIVAGKRRFAIGWLAGRRARAAFALGDLLLYMGLVGVMVFLATK